MPPKSKPPTADPSSDPTLLLFQSLGLPPSKAIEANKNPKVAATLRGLIEAHALTGLDEKRAVLITALAGALAKVDFGPDESGFVVQDVLDGRLKSVDQVSGEYAFSGGGTLADSGMVYSCGEVCGDAQNAYRSRGI